MTITANDIALAISQFFTSRDPSDESQSGFDSLQWLRADVLKAIAQACYNRSVYDARRLDTETLKLRTMQDGAPIFSDGEVDRQQDKVHDIEARVAVQREMARQFGAYYKLDCGKDWTPYEPKDYNAAQTAAVAKALAALVPVATPATTSEDEHAAQVKPRTRRQAVLLTSDKYPVTPSVAVGSSSISAANHGVLKAMRAKSN